MVAITDCHGRAISTVPRRSSSICAERDFDELLDVSPVVVIRHVKPNKCPKLAVVIMRIMQINM